MIRVGRSLGDRRADRTGDGRTTLDHESAGSDWHPSDADELRYRSVAGGKGISLYTTDAFLKKNHLKQFLTSF